MSDILQSYDLNQVTPNQTPQTTTQTADNGNTLQVAEVPTQRDFLDEAKKIADMRTDAAAEQLQYATRNLAEDVGRQLYSQNVGATSGVGQELANRAIDTQLQQYRPYIAETQANLATDALNYEIEKDRSRQAIANQYGIDPATGQPFASSEAGKSYWQKQGFTTDLSQKYGMNQDTKKPFQSEAEALEYWGKRGANTELTQQYGTKDDGTAFNSKQEAIDYYAQQGFQRELLNKYGTDGNAPFESLAAAESYWDSQGFDKDLTKKYGLNNDTQPPTGFKSESEAIEFWEKRGYDRKMVEEYGLNPDTGEPFKSTLQAQTYYNERPARLETLFNMAMNGTLKGDPLDAILSEFNLTQNDVDIPTMNEMTIEAYIDSKLAADQPIDVAELQQILKMSGLQEGDINKESFIYSPTFAQSILSTEDKGLIEYLTGKGFTHTTEFKGDLGPFKWDGYWVMDKTKDNMDRFKKLYQEDADFREYVNGFIA
jgi:hypothetical protein